MNRPTTRQAQVLEFLKKYTATWGNPPTFREIGQACGISPGTVFEHLNALEKRGLVARNSKERRSVHIIEGVSK